jgi:xylulokinase
VLGIDLGTSGCKAGLFSQAGALLALARGAYPVDRDASGRTEQDPAQWWRGACAAVQDVLRTAVVPADGIAALGLSGQIGSQVLIDRQGRPLRPAITWRDVYARLATIHSQEGHA